MGTDCGWGVGGAGSVCGKMETTIKKCKIKENKKYALSTYVVLGTVLDAGDRAENEKDKDSRPRPPQ